MNIFRDIVNGFFVVFAFVCLIAGIIHLINNITWDWVTYIFGFIVVLTISYVIGKFFNGVKDLYFY